MWRVIEVIIIQPVFRDVILHTIFDCVLVLIYFIYRLKKKTNLKISLLINENCKLFLVNVGRVK